MVLETQQHPEQLKDDICSPGGTSAFALHRLEASGFRGSLIDAVQAGTERSKNIGGSDHDQFNPNPNIAQRVSSWRHYLEDSRRNFNYLLAILEGLWVNAAERLNMIGFL